MDGSMAWNSRALAYPWHRFACANNLTLQFQYLFKGGELLSTTVLPNQVVCSELDDQRKKVEMSNW
jgi:hypothetical protein